MITVIRNFFDLNYELVLFVYGQVFFVLGLAIALQSRRHSRLELARSLPWLALFGISHGLHEWGHLLIPIQATYLNDFMLGLMFIIQVLLLGISFVALFQFGVALLRPRWPWLQRVLLVLAAGWTAFILIRGLLAPGSIGLWQQEASILARYLLGLPGAMLAAFGLRYQAVRQIKPLQMRRIYETLRLAGLALGAYAFFAGLVVPAGDFFPANWLNQSFLVQWTGVPAPVFRSLTGLVLVITIIRAMEVFDLEVDRLIEEMEIEQSLAAERERIGRELHDGAIQRVYTAGLIIESARRKVGDDTLVGQRLDRAMTALNEAIGSLRTYMSELRAEPSAQSLVEGLHEVANDPRVSTLMHVELVTDVPETTNFNPAQVSHILAIVSEALANVARHAQARTVTVRATCENGQLILSVADDGIGFENGASRSGYGLRNMRDRARLLGGELTIDAEPGRGTRVTLVAPWEET